jgi:hypothetical protein
MKIYIRAFVVAHLVTCGIEAFMFQPTRTVSSTNIIGATAKEQSRYEARTASPTSLYSSNQNKITSEVKPLEAIELTNEKIAEMLEVTFIQACLQLATGYVDMLKLFLASASAGYDRAITIPQLMQMVADCPENTANRDLSEQEIELRSGWLSLSYLTLETIDRQEGKVELAELSIPNNMREEYGSIIEQKVRNFLGSQSEVASEPASPSDPQQAAIFAYNLKVISFTLSNVEEARDANELAPTIDEDGVGPPRPKIPGPKIPGAY